jgi:hypothetical protein
MPSPADAMTVARSNPAQRAESKLRLARKALAKTFAGYGDSSSVGQAQRFRKLFQKMHFVATRRRGWVDGDPRKDVGCGTHANRASAISAASFKLNGLVGAHAK